MTESQTVDRVQEYFEHSAVNQSYLKSLLNGVDLLSSKDEQKLHYEEKGHFVIGNGVDVYLTQGKAEFEKQFFVSPDTKKPSDTIMSITHYVFDKLMEENDISGIGALIEYEEKIFNSCELHKYYGNLSRSVRVNKIVVAASDYFESLKEAFGKQIISSQENTIIKDICTSLTTNPTTAHHFEEREDVEILYQVPIYFEFEGVDCKALLDMVVINHAERTVQGIDIKTLGQFTSKFKTSFVQRRYDFQATFYKEALQVVSDYGRFTSPEISLDTVGGYTVLPFKFIVETTMVTTLKDDSFTTLVGKPLEYTVSQETETLAMEGRGELTLYGSDDKGNLVPLKFKAIKGIKQALSLYVWHISNGNGFDVDRDIADGSALML